MDLCEGKKLFVAFLESYLGVEHIGFQSGFGFRPDLILFKGPCGSTLAVETTVMLLPREEAREKVTTRIEASLKAFRGGQP